jgi:hypothetical protein
VFFESLAATGGLQGAENCGRKINSISKTRGGCIKRIILERNFKFRSAQVSGKQKVGVLKGKYLSGIVNSAQRKR